MDVCFLLGVDEDPDEVANVDVEVRLADGSRWGGAIFTVAEVDRLLARWARTGEHAGGSYFYCVYSFVVRDSGVGNMTRALAALHDHGNLTDVFNRLDEVDQGSPG
jgi:hypothetical protein